MTLAATLLVYCALILVASLLGGWIPLWVRMTHRRMELAVSFVAGVMLGVGTFHMVPHAFHELRSIDRVVWWMLCGFLLMFLVERFFCYHHHPSPAAGTARDGGPAGGNHDHGPVSEGHTLGWSGAFTGLTLHTLLAGIALAASTCSEWQAGSAARLAGFGTFLVIFLHKPLDSMTIGTLLAAGNWSVRFRHLINGLFALVIPAGVALFFLGLRLDTGEEAVFVGCALAFSAGTFLCIAMSDLLPELHFHRHDRITLTLALLLGLALAYGISCFENAGHGNAHAAPASGPSIEGGHAHGDDDAHGDCRN
ncbi:MAG: ZIP family metal transporter [Planctomycetes bacterium]|nr:ZIP family metal transporter [Planctomycetota bacterium]